MSTTMTLTQLMTAVRQRADMLPSGYAATTSGNTSLFVTDSELISYINQSYFELYDILVTAYEDWFVATPVTFQTDGTNFQYTLPDGTLYSAAPALYKLLGVDLSVNTSANAWVTLKKFNFIARNRYIYPQVTTSYMGPFNLRYRIMGNTLYFIPTPSSGMTIRLWYAPRLTQLSALSDTADGISGWTEYVICDGAIKCGQKEETDVSVLMAQKADLLRRIEAAAMNRDAGEPDTISDTRRYTNLWGNLGGPDGDGSSGGY